MVCHPTQAYIFKFHCTHIVKHKQITNDMKYQRHKHFLCFWKIAEKKQKIFRNKNFFSK